MTIQKHLERRLKEPYTYSLSNEEKKTIQFEGIETFIFNKLTSRKFRKTAISEESQQRVKDAIKINIEKNKPIKFTYPFGGYKIWRVPTFPNADWAEFMTISYLIRYVSPILTTYKHGVEIYLSSDDAVIELIDNYPRKDLDAYINSVQALLAEFSQYFPENLKVDIKQAIPDYYTKEEYEQELDALANKCEITSERHEKLNQFFNFNFMRDGKEDYTDDAKYNKNLPRLMKYSDAYLQLSKRKDFIRGDDKIVLFSSPIPNAIDIGSTNVSMAKFWAGIGVFESDGNLFFDRVMTPKQWLANENDVIYENVKLFNLPNFDKVPVFNKRFNFRT